MEFDLEFKEFCPISATRPSLLRALSKKINFHLERNMSGVTKEEIEPTLMSECGDCVTTLATSSPSSEEPTNPRVIDLTDFVKMFKHLRAGGKTPGDSVQRISSQFILGSECVELVFKSGLMDYLKYPSEPSKMTSCRSGIPEEQKGSGG
jgi:hypothetical protein